MHPPDTFYQYPGPVFGAGADGAAGAVFRNIVKLHQIWTEVGITDDTPWTIAVGWIGNSNGMNVQHALASSRLTPN